ncbi:Na+/H+ antiporter NhaA [Streptomyces ardesiacus]|uniref:Na+/H+ antiporter NhaA n=1 Tax=Streptomyces ardesiacus TaxID=285564 RepID=UPI0036EE3242
MATGIAFAVAVLAVVGRHLPTPLRTCLLTLATVDDKVRGPGHRHRHRLHQRQQPHRPRLGRRRPGRVRLLAEQSGRAVARVRAMVPAWLLFVPLAAVVWALMHACGVHATIAGVVMGLSMRTHPQGMERVSPSHRAEEVLRPFSAGIALPLFALMSAGVSLAGAGGFVTSAITWNVLAGLLVGKVVGIFGGTWPTSRLTSAHLNPLLGWADIAGIAVLGGIGFTVSLLIAELSSTSQAHLTDAKGAILLACTTAALLAALLLGRRSRLYQRLARQAAQQATT